MIRVVPVGGIPRVVDAPSAEVVQILVDAWIGDLASELLIVGALRSRADSETPGNILLRALAAGPPGGAARDSGSR